MRDGYSVRDGRLVVEVPAGQGGAADAAAPCSTRCTGLARRPLVESTAPSPTRCRTSRPCCRPGSGVGPPRAAPAGPRSAVAPARSRHRADRISGSRPGHLTGSRRRSPRVRTFLMTPLWSTETRSRRSSPSRPRAASRDRARPGRDRRSCPPIQGPRSPSSSTSSLGSSRPRAVPFDPGTPRRARRLFTRRCQAGVPATKTRLAESSTSSAGSASRLDGPVRGHPQPRHVAGRSPGDRPGRGRRPAS